MSLKELLEASLDEEIREEVQAAENDSQAMRALIFPNSVIHLGKPSTSTGLTREQRKVKPAVQKLPDPELMEEGELETSSGTEKPAGSSKKATESPPKKQLERMVVKDSYNAASKMGDDWNPRCIIRIFG